MKGTSFEGYEENLGGEVMKKLLLVCLTATAFGCASPSVVEVVMPGDEELNCGQLKNAYAEAERFKSEAKGEKGMTGGNMARGLLFWPAVVGTYMNSNEAIQAAASRKVHLMNIMRDKKCDGLESL